MPPGPARDAGAVVVAVYEPVLASSLELTLLASGFSVVVYDPTPGLEGLPIADAAVLILGPRTPTADPSAFVEGLGARAWDGLVILMTGDGEALRRVFERSDRVVVLEMPFVGADLIAAIRNARAPGDPG